MSIIIAGLFEERASADSAVARLGTAGVGKAAISVFGVNAPGQHGRYPIGGDRDESPGAENAEGGALKGVGIGAAVGAAAGAAAAFAVGPLAIPIAAGVGAYTGSLVGALNGMDEDPKRAQEAVRSAGTMVAVNLSASGVDITTVAGILKQSGAVEVERAEGEWHDGTWADFDALRSPQRVDVPPPVPNAERRLPRAG